LTLGSWPEERLAPVGPALHLLVVAAVSDSELHALGGRLAAGSDPIVDQNARMAEQHGGVRPRRAWARTSNVRLSSVRFAY
jgi:hypothetical protein